MTEVKFIMPWQMYSKGDVITPNGVLRDFLISAGFVVLVPAKKYTHREIKKSVNRKRR